MNKIRGERRISITVARLLRIEKLSENGLVSGNGVFVAGVEDRLEEDFETLDA